MEFWLQQNSDKFQLPVKPSDYTVSVAHKNTVVQCNTGGRCKPYRKYRLKRNFS